MNKLLALAAIGAAVCGLSGMSARPSEAALANCPASFTTDGSARVYYGGASKFTAAELPIHYPG